MPHVCLVALTGFRVADPELRELGLSLPGLRRRGEAIAALPALGLLTLAAHTPSHWTQSFHEAAAVDAALVEDLCQYRPALVAISALTASIEEAYSLCAAIRARGVRSVIGGLHATALPQEVLRHADAVVVGDGETAWPGVLERAESGSLRGMIRGEQFRMAESRMPRWELLPAGKRRRFTVQTSRGCPLACEFCGASRLLGPYRQKPPQCVAAELAAIKAIDPCAVIELADDNTFAGLDDADGLLQALADAGLPWFTECDWRISQRPNLCKAMAAAGCAQVLLGVESPVHSYAGMGPKGAPAQRMFEAIVAIQDCGIAVNACFVAGADGETCQSMEQLGELVAACPAADVQLTLQTPFPGTALRARLARAGRLLEDRTWKLHTLFEVTHRPDRMTVAELQAGFRQLLARLYSPAEARRRARMRHQIWRGRHKLVASE